MTRGITIQVNTMTKEQIALLFVSFQLDQNPLFNTRLMNETSSYKDMGAVVYHDAKDRKNFFKFAGAKLVADTKRTAIEKLMKVGLLPDFFSRLYTKAIVSELEVSSRFLLSHNHSARRVAEHIFPADCGKNDAETRKSEKFIMQVIDLALAAVNEVQTPSLKALLQSRRTDAEQRLLRLEAKALG